MVDGFPRLVPGSFRTISPQTTSYNCIAWAAGISNRWWWPEDNPFCYWPPGVPVVASIGSFKEAYGTLGYETCQDGSLEAGFEKIVIYATQEGIPKHAARQLPNGKWTSKLGKNVDIEHEDPDVVSGPKYGQPVLFMKRPLQQ